MTDSVSAPRSYGGWRRSHSIGIGSLDTRQSIMLMAAIMIPLLSGMILGISFAVYLLAPAAIAAALAVARRDGVLVMDILRAWTAWRWAEWRTHTIYLGQVFQPVPHHWDMPGVLAPTRLLDVAEPGRDRVGVCWNQRTGHMSATVLLSPAGALLADADTIDRQVAGWGQLLAGLADDQTIQHAAVTVELVPEPGTQLADHVNRRIDPLAPELARQVMHDMVCLAPRASAKVLARLTLTCDPSVGATRARTVPQAVAELLRSLGGLSVSAAGAEILRRASATDLIRIVRTAYDPASEAITDGWHMLRWGDAGPMHARDGFEVYRHDGVYSMSWVLLEAPRQRISHDVLLPLLSPGRFRRRLTLTYRTLPRDVAAGVLERELTAAAAREEYRRRTKRDPRARDRADADRAARAAAEEAHGAGLVLWTVYVTVTVADRAELAQARREIEQAAGHARLKLRLAYGGQAAAFAAGLPCGVYPGDG
jgi:hypothetical protein